MKIASILMFLLLLAPVMAVDYSDVDELVARVTITNDYTITKIQSDGKVTNVTARFSVYPVDDFRQRIISTQTTPEAFPNADQKTYTFYWSRPNPHESMYIQSRIQTTDNTPHIIKKVAFPIEEIDASLSRYIDPTPTIDVTPEIQALASELSAGKDDLYEVEYAFAEYVRKTVEYDLSSLTEDSVQKSSWVLENKRGVCDEITNLFASLNRAVGIPVRFSSGIAYTNLDIFGANWVPHAWAEVYFPGNGWVPYDVTYGQYGFVDAGHIKLEQSHDSKGSNVKYEFVGTHVDLQPGKITHDVDVESYGAVAKRPYTFSVDLLEDHVGFDSYNVVIVSVRNPQTYYQVADLYLANTENVLILEDSKEKILNRSIYRKQVLLRPGEEKKVYWLIQLNGNFNARYSYTLPITIYNSYNQSSTIDLESQKEYDSLERTYAREYIVSKQEELAKIYSSQILLNCNPDRAHYYPNDPINVTCILDNKGTQSFADVELCIDGSCSTRSLAPGYSFFSFLDQYSTTGIRTIPVKVSHEEFVKTYYVPLRVLDKPTLLITHLEYPNTVLFNDQFSFSFDLESTSDITPENVTVTVRGPFDSKTWHFDKLEENRHFVIESVGRSMRNGANTYTIDVVYSDERKTSYAMTQSAIITADGNALQKMLLYFNVLGYNIEQLFT